MTGALDHHKAMKLAMKIPHLSRMTRLAAASLLLLTASACGSAPPPAGTGAGTGTPTEQMWQKIQAASADNACDDASQCHTIGVGAKACGGPQSYLAWSSKNGNGAELKQLVAVHAAARRAEDANGGMMSTCSMMSDPGASCRAGRCELNAQQEDERCVAIKKALNP